MAHVCDKQLPQKLFIFEKYTVIKMPACTFYDLELGVNHAKILHDSFFFFFRCSVP